MLSGSKGKIQVLGKYKKNKILNIQSLRYVISAR